MKNIIKDPLKGNPQVVSVRILVAAYQAKIGFNVPKAAASAIGLRTGKKKPLWVSITSADGRCLYAGDAILKSGNEVYVTLEAQKLTKAIECEPRLWIDIFRRMADQ
ncbi:MAG TPA: hypothetical protein VGT04_13070 [Acidobacteriaceae bacterium]|nr:hypothetical protein [Acidobacteriaceae bacterium]